MHSFVSFTLRIGRCMHLIVQSSSTDAQHTLQKGKTESKGFNMGQSSIRKDNLLYQHNTQTKVEALLSYIYTDGGDKSTTRKNRGE